MRDKQDILNDVHTNILKAPLEGQPMLLHELYFIEVVIDIRDILAADMKTALAISKAMSKKEGS